jgi:hypothetical protein
MEKKHFLRGMATVNFWADDVAAARDWYAELFGVEAYFQRPDPENPAYVEFRIGDNEDEFGIIDRKYAPKAMQQGLAERSCYGMWMKSRLRSRSSRLWARKNMIRLRNAATLALSQPP